MTQPVPSRISSYQIIREIGRGGMGVVYLARDERLDRDVAIKALPPELASDPARLERFEREARALAQLNHPNVAGIYGVEEQDGQKYLILEYVEGETLGHRLDRGAIPVDEAIEIAEEIAAGVEAAHEAGVIHRDLKPDNIKLTAEGKVKVLDFGLARRATSTSAVDAMTSPTVVGASPTIPGAILGTAAYMSPEQARGRHVDKRTDIWSFGVILYEMLTGASPFCGETATDSIGAVLHKQIDLERLPAQTPQAVRRALTRCLVRDKAGRYRDIADVAIELRQRVEAPEPGSDRAGGRGARLIAGAAAGVIIGAVIGWLVGATGGAEADPGTSVGGGAAAPLTVDLAPPDGYVIARRNGPPRLSPDGNALALVVRKRPGAAGGEFGPSLLCVKDLTTGENAVYDQHAGISFPTWSPDGRHLMYGASDAVVYRVDLSTGRAETVFAAAGSYPRGAAWMPDGTLAAAVDRQGIRRWDMATGQPLETIAILTSDETGGGFPAWPVALPDGVHYLFSYVGDDTLDGVYLGRIGEDEHVRLLASVETQTRYLPPEGDQSGYIYFSRGSAIFRQALDLEPPALVGRPQLVAENVWTGQWPYFAPFDVGPGGRLVYFRAPAIDFENELVRLDVQTGVETSTGLTGSLWNPMYSSDDRHLLLDITTDATNGDIYSIDLQRNYLQTLISGTSVNETFPIWIGDDNDTIVFFHDGDLFMADHGGVRRPRPILEGPESYMPIAATPEGQTLFYFDAFAADAADMYQYDMATGDSRRWLDIDIFDLRVAPNGQWVIVLTGRPAMRQLELRRYPQGDGRIIVDTGVVGRAEWTQDGSRLFYEKDDRLVMVEVTWPAASGDAADSQVGAPRFSDPTEILSMRNYREYDVNSDGSEIMLIKLIEQRVGDSIRLVQASPPPNGGALAE